MFISHYGQCKTSDKGKQVYREGLYTFNLLGLQTKHCFHCIPLVRTSHVTPPRSAWAGKGKTVCKEERTVRKEEDAGEPSS